MAKSGSKKTIWDHLTNMIALLSFASVCIGVAYTVFKIDNAVETITKLEGKIDKMQEDIVALRVSTAELNSKINGKP